MSIAERSHVKGETHHYISPVVEINAGLWTLFAGTSIFLALRLWCKIARSHGLWYDDWILIVCWFLLITNNTIISVEYATGYIADTWDDRMRILVSITSCGTLLNQAWSKTAFGVTLLRLSEKWQRWVLCFCIATMNIYAIIKVFLQWGKVCESESSDVWWRLDFCTSDDVRDQIKEGGNVYNLLMDFVFAIFPWILVWKLRMSKSEKISLCITLSLGIIIAISTAIRTAWKDDDAKHDEWYFWDNAMSQIWFSSEICGTIIVQCIPILRPFLKELPSTVKESLLKSRETTLFDNPQSASALRSSMTAGIIVKTEIHRKVSDKYSLEAGNGTALGTSENSAVSPYTDKYDCTALKRQLSSHKAPNVKPLPPRLDSGSSWPFPRSENAPSSRLETTPEYCFVASKASWLDDNSSQETLQPGDGLSPPPKQIRRGLK